MAREALKVTSEKALGVIAYPDGVARRIVVSLLETSIGKQISVQDQYQVTGETEWKKGKGKWLKFEMAEDIAKAILVAYNE